MNALHEANIESHSSLPEYKRIYPASNIVIRDSLITQVEDHKVCTSAFLPVELDDYTFYLPIVPVDVPGNYIAWFDSHPDHHPMLADRAAAEIARLVPDDVSLFYSLPTSKSYHMTRGAIRRTNQRLDEPVSWIQFLSGQSKDEIKKKVYDGEYLTDGKYIGVTRQNAEDINDTHGEGLVAVDDVHRTGLTFASMRRIIRTCLGGPEDEFPDTKLPVIVAAKEAVDTDMDNLARLTMPEGLTAIMVIPRITNPKVAMDTGAFIDLRDHVWKVSR